MIAVIVTSTKEEAERDFLDESEEVVKICLSLDVISVTVDDVGETGGEAAASNLSRREGLADAITHDPFSRLKGR